MRPSHFALLSALALGGCKRAAKAPAKAPPPPSDPYAAIVAGSKVQPDAQRPRRVVVLALDGVDPTFADSWLKKLGNLRSFVNSNSSLPRLATTLPPTSLAAWSTFATGLTPFHHGKLALLERQGAAGHTRYTGPTFEPQSSGPATPSWDRHGRAFWEVTAEAGIPTKVFQAPYAEPVATLPNLSLWAGEGSPDWTLTGPNFTYFATDLDRTRATAVPGGELVRLEGGSPFKTTIEGPLQPDHSPTRVPIAVEVSSSSSAELRVGDAMIHLDVGTWSRSFAIDGPGPVHGVARAFLVEAQPAFELYVSPVGPTLEDPFVVVATPAAWAKSLAQAKPDLPTTGWALDTYAVDAGVLPVNAFLKARERNFNARKDTLLAELEKDDARLVVAVFDDADRVGHVTWRLMDASQPSYDARLAAQYGGALNEVYIDLDKLVGEVRARLRTQDRLLIISPYGMNATRRSFDANAWLADAGYLAVQPPPKGVVPPGPTTAPGATPSPSTPRIIDWSKTRISGAGQGFLYINVQGDHTPGTVRPDDAPALAAELQKKLGELKDPKSGEHPIAKVHSRWDAGAKDWPADGPDLILGFADGWAPSPASVQGDVGNAIYEDRPRPWSGDHAASDPAEVAGFITGNIGTLRKDPSLADIAPTVFQLLEVPTPEGLDGTSLLQP